MDEVGDVKWDIIQNMVHEGCTLYDAFNGNRCCISFVGKCKVKKVLMDGELKQFATFLTAYLFKLHFK